MPPKLNKALMQRIHQHLADYDALDPMDRQRTDGGAAAYVARKLKPKVSLTRAATLIRMAHREDV